MVFLARQVGLANRLRALVGYEAVCRLLDRPFSLCWVPDVACDARFSDLFDAAAFQLVDPGQIPELRSRGDTLVCAEPIWFHDIWRRHVPQIPWLLFLREVDQSLSRLRATPVLARAAAAFATAHAIPTVVGIHIRHTDNVALHGLRSQLDADFDVGSVSTLNGFRRAIATHIATGPLFLATDNAAVERALRAEFGDALLTYPKHYEAEWRSPDEAAAALLEPRTTPVGDALIEMLLLRSCRRIFGTYYSSFSELAAIWGRVDYHDVKGEQLARNSQVDATIVELQAAC